MYNPSTVDGKTMIHVGGQMPDKNRVTPLCSVPIQTTATLNIQLFPVPGGGQRSPDSAKNGMPSPRMTLSTTTSTNPKTTKTFAVNPDVSATSPTVNHSPRDDNHKHTEAVRKMSSGSTDQRSPTALTSSETMTDQLSVSDVSDHTQQANAAAAVAAASAAAASAAAAAAAAAASTMNVATTSVGVGEDNADDAFTAVVRTDSRSTGSATDSFTSTGDLTAPELHEAFAWTDGNTEEYDASGGMSTSATATCSVTTSDSSHDVASYNQLSSAAVGEKYNEYQGDSSESYRSEVADVTALPPAAESGSSVELDKPEASSFRFIGWDVMDELKSSVSQVCRRVLVLKDSEVVLMFKASCTTEKAGNDPRLLALMGDIAENCAKRLSHMRDMLPQLSAQHMDTLPLKDGRQTGEHLAEISQAVGESVTITDVAYRFQPQEPNVYVGTYVYGKIVARRQYAIGSAGVLTVMTKKNKYATVEAFSEQLCEHIIRTRPSGLGLFEGDRRAGRVSQCRRVHPQRDQLLLQTFTFDPTIIVAEAARRCFVTVDDFLLFR